ncbi:choice-of-anchor Q domain-containing protein [Occultella gossypii]|uniref:Right-handed parallel beta-helix repeat-containing protein n=1 Tax=Occultella gossypii TaxID=2800820 RepID=A0ABS7SJR5_9MICO|nr:right-handed parallel beta-helix repeat-containing protein [Occultella gossypii]MBZ2199538.1 right-handed parallel beta-helix repeat-containing protein [Occultella gossypii]
MRTAEGRTAIHNDQMGNHRHLRRRLVAFGSAVVAATALSVSGGALPAAAAGLTWYVDQAAGADAPDCGAAAGADACATIGAALAQVTPDDIVAIAAGSYAEALTVTTPVTLQGASTGEVVLTNPSVDDTAMVLIDADGAVTIADMSFVDESVSNDVRPVIQLAENRAATLSGIVISGAPTGPGAGTIGVLTEGGSTVTIENAAISGTFYGVTAGGLLTEPGDPVPATVSISESSIAATGAGVALLAGEATITGGSVSGSLGAGLLGYTGAAVFNVTGTAITDSGAPEGGTFRGGVVLYQGGTFLGDDVTISGNDNGVMLPEGGTVTLTNSTVTDNAGAEAGNGIWGRPGPDGEPVIVELTGTQVSANGVGLALEDAQTQIIDSTIADNYTGLWLTASAEGSSLELTNSAVTDNVADIDNGGGALAAGAGVYLLRVDSVVTDTEISGNVMGMYAEFAEVTVTGGVIADNGLAGLFSAERPHSEERTTVDLTGTTISGNGLEADSLGAGFGFGGIAMRFSTVVTGHDLTISGNALGASVSGGTLSLTDSSVTDGVSTALDDVLGPGITGNGFLVTPAGAEWLGEIHLLRTEVSGNAGRGLWLAESSGGTVVASTIAENGGLGIDANLGSVSDDYPEQPLLVAGSTVAENGEGALSLTDTIPMTVIGSIVQAPAGVAACTGEPAGLIDGGANVLSDETCGAPSATNVVGDPLLDALADNGGPTHTALPSMMSPAVDLVPTGTAVSWSGDSIDVCPGTVDQRGPGFPRLLGDACDAGAVERTPGGLITVTASDATTYEGAFEPEVTAAYAGFVGDDTVDDLDTLPTCSYDIDTATTFCSGGADDFYTFEYVNGTLTVLAPLVIVTDSLPDAEVDVEYSVTLEATGGNGGPYTWGMSEGVLPAGLELDTETGEISGVPEAAGDVTFTVFVGDPITKEFTISVAAAPTEPTTPPTTEPTTPPTTEPTAPPTSGSTNPPSITDPTAAAPPVDQGQGLPDTGSDTLPALAATAAILLLGAALLLIRRRQQHQRSVS